MNPIWSAYELFWRKTDIITAYPRNRMTLEGYLRWVNRARPGRFVWMSSILGAPYNPLGKAIAPPSADPADDGPEVIAINLIMEGAMMDLLFERCPALEVRDAKPR